MMRCYHAKAEGYPYRVGCGDTPEQAVGCLLVGIDTKIAGTITVEPKEECRMCAALAAEEVS